MNKKIIFILLGGLLILALIFVLWFWFFGRNKSEVLPNNGSFGAGQDTGNAGGSTGSGGNGQTPIGSNTGSTVNGGGSGSSGQGAGSGSSYYIGTSSNSYLSTPSGVTWFSGSSGGGGINSFGFSQTPINDINNGIVSGSPYITTIKGADGKDVSLASGLLVVIGGCALTYTGNRLIIAPLTEALSAITDSIGSILGDIFGIHTAANPQAVSDNHEQGNTSTQTVTDCLTRTLGKLAVQAITESTINWINSGFNGQPAYVQDFGKFFSDVADNAAGNFIEGTGLAFLCSPFQLQVKIAIAQSYANSNSGSASSCTLSGIEGNVDQFLKGDFSQGGWQGFLRFTTVPANNPYAGYVQGQLALNSAIAYDKQKTTLTISPGGFLSQEKCDTDPTTMQTKNCKIVTPGSVIQESLNATFKGSVDELQVGDSIDQILGALSNALITKVLYSGLGNTNAQANSSSGNNAATTKAQALMNSIQASVTAAQQYASVKQRSISDIQIGQQNLAQLGNCWAQATSSPSATPAAVTQGTTGFNNVVTTLTQLQTQVNTLNASIAAANTSITRLQDIQTDLLLATVAADVTSVDTQFTALKAGANPHIYMADDVTSANLDRQTLQSQMNGINQNTSSQLTQCYALGK